MKSVSVRELRNDGARVLERVIAGEELTVTRDGHPIAELRPIGKRHLDARTLIERFARLPAVDPVTFRSDVDAAIDCSL